MGEVVQDSRANSGEEVGNTLEEEDSEQIQRWEW